MKSDNKLIEMLCDSLDEFALKGKLTAADVDMVSKLATAKEKLLRAEQIEEEKAYSNSAYMRNDHAMYPDRTMYADSSYGRHYVRGHYSRSSMRDKIADMMESGDLTQSQRVAMQRIMDEM